jgi:CHAT domain-containing protein/Tfp pilus assembly protein PilF
MPPIFRIRREACEIWAKMVSLNLLEPRLKLPAASISAARSVALRVFPLVCSLLLPFLSGVPGASAAAPVRLTEGIPVERVLGGEEQQELRVAVEAGWYVRLEIEQIGVDVSASLLGADGALLFSTDDPDGLQDSEVLALIAPAAEALRLVVAAHDPRAAPGTYRVVLTALRPAGPGDAERAAAQKVVAAAGHRLALGGEEGKREAIPSLQEAARLWAASGETREQVDALNELGTVQNSLSETSDALASFRRALALSAAAGDLRRQARSQTNLAGALLSTGDYAQTLENYRQALDLWIALGDTREQGRVLYGIGLIHRDRGDFDAALRYLSEALPLRQTVGDVQGELNTLIALAGVHQGRGDTAKASDCLSRALELARKAGGEGEENVLSTLAQLHRYRGELGEAFDILNKARAFYQREGNQILEARVLHHLGVLNLDLGDVEESRSSFEQGLALVTGKSAEGESRFLNSLGWTLYLRGDPQAALTFFEKALALSKAKSLPAGVAQALGYKGVVYVSLGRAAQGLQLLQEELALRRENGDRLAEAVSLVEIGGAWQALGDGEQAAASFRTGLDLGRRVGNTTLQAACLYRWALLDRQRGDLRQAAERVESAIQIIESVRSRVSSEKLRTLYLASKRAWYELYIDLQMRLEELEPGKGHAAAALEASERARARGLLDLIAEGRIDVQEGITPELKRKETELGARLSWIQEQLGRIPAGGAEGGQAAALQIQLGEAGEAMERLEEEIRRRHPRYAEVRYPTPLRLAQVEGLLDDRTSLLEYFVGEEASFLFLVSRTGLSVYPLPPADVLAKKAQELRKTLERPGILTLGRFRLAAGDLYEILLGAAGAQLAKTPNLLISPDGPLFLLPFEVLLADPARGGSYRDLGYLIRDHAVSYVPSASVLAGLREQRPASPPGTPLPKGLIAFGDPISPAARVASAPVRATAFPWTAPELPGSGREVRAIADLYPAADVELYLRERATEENVKANPLIQTARRIHFATHGFIDEARPQLSGLMLTRDAASGQDGLLQVYEIFNLQLNAELVTLSACETALGAQVTGEGMVGLTRAFLYAGARSLLVSLWPVSDLSTPELMAAFYRDLGAGSKAEALRRAKLDRILAGEEPYRWAPFILAGDPH